MRCVYCNKEIINSIRPKKDVDHSKVYTSSEHIIQNALGGKLESKEICCDRCNLHLQKLIDDGFCKIFVPFTSEIENFRKTNNTGSKPKTSGYAIRNSDNKMELLKADVIKKSQVKQSKELIKREKANGTEDLDERVKDSLDNMEVAFQNFNMDNKYFKQGLSKIAYNYAIYLGINPSNLNNTCEVKLDGINRELSDIQFNTKVIPFVAGNELDSFIELDSSCILFHNMIMYQYCNELWCYIDLFNTFQYYVLLCDDFGEQEKVDYKIYGEEFQYVQSNKNSSHSFFDVINEKSKEYYSIKDKYLYSLDYDFYFNHGKLASYFRIYNPVSKISESEFIFYNYPEWIVRKKTQEEIKDYTTKKYVRLNQSLVKLKPVFSTDRIVEMSKDDQNKFWELYQSSMRPYKK